MSGVPEIRLYWWRGQPNFGDELSRDVVAHVSGAKVTWSKPWRADLFAIGSLMNFVRRGALNRPETALKPIVWGTGFMEPMPVEFLKRVDVRLLRGPISATIANLASDQFGDPGLLASDVFRAVSPHGEIGIVPHHSQVDSTEIVDFLLKNPNVRLIDVRDGAASACEKISACSAIYSSSLHGLIVADSYGIPNYWFETKPLRAHSRFKFLDYGISVGRELTAPMALGDIDVGAIGPRLSRLPYRHKILEVRNTLVETFPIEFRANG